ncbi:MAG: alpha/beta fold hydrolase [Rhodocyclaceae bacterium]
MQPFPPFRAPRWLRGGHAQTVVAKLTGARPPPYRRIRWETPDGDFLDTDWIEPRPGAPLVVLFHGLEGSSRSHYCAALMHAAAARGWNGVVVHFRGCSGELNRLPRAYHSGDDTEIDWILRRLRADQPAALYAAGVSLGGNALLKWMGMRGAAACEVIDAAAAVCAPVDLAAAARALEHGFGRVYARYFLRTLKPVALAKLRRFPGLYPREAVLAARSLREFDDAVTAPLHGFRDAADYYARSSAGPWLSGIRVPTLMIHAADDPFLPAAALPRAAELPEAVRLECPQHGGHVGFVSGPFLGRHEWLPRRLLAFFACRPPGFPAA